MRIEFDGDDYESLKQGSKTRAHVVHSSCTFRPVFDAPGYTRHGLAR